MADDQIPEVTDFTRIEARLSLVNKFNIIQGQPSLAVSSTQAQFVRGEMLREDEVSLIRLYNYLISATPGIFDEAIGPRRS